VTALLIDGSNAAMRAIHAMSRSGLSAGEVPTAPLVAFIGTLRRHIAEERPDKVVVAWDTGRSAYRTGIDPNYKGQRNPAPEFEEYKNSAYDLMKRFLSLANVHHVGVKGHEADDIIAYYWRHNRPLAEKLVIVSSDKDFLQLLVPNECEQVRLGSHDTPTDRWTYERLEAEVGACGQSYIDAMALAGDSSDNIPGVPRFGMKTAVKTLAKYRNLDIAIQCDERLTEHRERIMTNRKLIDLTSLGSGLDLPPLPPFAPTKPGDLLFGDLLSFLTRYQMDRVKDALYAGTLWHPGSP
jgi:DNA polymerase-1